MKFTKWLMIVFVLAVLTLILNIVFTGFVIVSDGLSRYVYLRSAVIDGDLNFTNEYEDYNNTYSILSKEPRLNQDNIRLVSKKGYLINPYLIGNAILWLPFFLLAIPISFMLNLPIDGYNFIFEFMIGFGSIFYAMIGFFLCYLILKRYYKEKIIIKSLLIIAFGTSITFFLFVDTTLSHLTSFFASTLCIFIWLKLRETEKSLYYILIGVVGALVILVRQPDGLFVFILPFIDFVRKIYRKESIKKYLLGVVAFLIVLSPQLLVWQTMYGENIVNQYPESGSSNTFGVNVVSDFGWYLLYQPFMLLGFFSLLLLKNRIKWIFFSIFLLQFTILMFFEPGSGLMPGRMFINLTFFIFLGLCELFRRFKSNYVYYSLLAISLAINVITIWGIV